MTSRAHWNVLFCLSFAAGCQSLGTVFPWQAGREPNYTMDELAAIDAPVTAAARHKLSADDSTKTGSVESGIALASYAQESPPVSAQRIDQLIRAGQAAIRAAGNGNLDALQIAQQSFEQALSLDAANPSAHHGMAIIADLQKDWPAAEFHYKQSLSSNPQDPNFLNDLGYSYLLQDRFHEAQQYLNQALNVAPQHERAQVNLSLLSLKRGDRAGAEQRLAKIYSPIDAQATLNRLEQDLQQNSVPATNTSTASQLASTLPESLMLQMQQERARAESARNQDTASTGQNQLTQQQPQNQTPKQIPISVYPPGMFENANGSVDAASQNVNPNSHMHGADQRSVQQQIPQRQTPMQMYGQPFSGSGEAIPQVPTQYAENQHRMMPQNLNNVGMSRGMQIPSLSDSHQQKSPPPNNSLQHGSNGGSFQLQNQANSSAFPINQQQYAGNGLIQQLQPGLPQQYAAENQQASPGQTMNNHQHTPPNAPLAGLNAGPGSLFPINTPMPQQTSQNRNPQQSYPAQQNGQQFVNAGYSQQPPGAPASGMAQGPTIATGNGRSYPHVRQTLPGDQMMSMHSQPEYYSNPTEQQQQFESANMAQAQYPGMQGQGYNQSHVDSQNMYNGGTQPNQTAKIPGALEAYEQQLQSLDNQYNQALRQMDGSGTGLRQPQQQY